MRFVALAAIWLILALTIVALAFLILQAVADAQTPTCRGRTPTHTGTNGNDTITGTGGRDIIWAGPGNDTIHAGPGQDIVCGGPGLDTIHGGRDGDWLTGGHGFDLINGGPGHDTVPDRIAWCSNAEITRTCGPPPPPTPTVDPVWDLLASCESGGNWSIHSASGTYHGGLQFSLSTWHAMGGAGDPHYQHRLEQIRIAENLRAYELSRGRGGFGPWPQCARKLGLPR